MPLFLFFSLIFVHIDINVPPFLEEGLISDIVRMVLSYYHNRVHGVGSPQQVKFDYNSGKPLFSLDILKSAFWGHIAELLCHIFHT